MDTPQKRVTMVCFFCGIESLVNLGKIELEKGEW